MTQNYKPRKHQRIIRRIENNYFAINSIQKIINSYFEKMCNELKNDSLEVYQNLLKLFDEYTLINRENKLGQSEFLTDSLYGRQMKLLELFGIYGLFDKIERIIWTEKIQEDIPFNRRYVYSQLFKIIRKFDLEHRQDKKENEEITFSDEEIFKAKVEDSFEVVET